MRMVWRLDGQGDWAEAQHKIGGCTLLRRGLRAASRTGVEDIVLIGRTSVDPIWPDPFITVPCVWHPKPVAEEAPTVEIVGAWALTSEAIESALALAPGESLLGPEGQLLARREGPEGGSVHAFSGAGVCRVRSREDAQALEHEIFSTLRKPLGRQADGVAAYYFNRPVSLTVTRGLIETRVRPNHVTLFNVGLGIFGGLWMALGGAWGLIGGALVMQLVSILDGVDGELARMKVMTSTQGAWLDAVSDDVVKMSMYLGLGYASAQLTGDPLYLRVAALGLVATILMNAFWYRAVASQGLDSLNMVRWWFEEEGREHVHPLWQGFLEGWGYLLKRDTYTLLLVTITIMGAPTLAFGLMSFGIAVIFVSTFGQRLAALLNPSSPRAAR